MTGPDAAGDAAPRTERMVATFEAEATPVPHEGDEEGRAVDYALRITRVRNAEPLTNRSAHPASAGLEVADTYAAVELSGGEESTMLRRVEILQGFDFDVAAGRVTGLLLFDRLVTAATSTLDESPAPQAHVVAPAVATAIVSDGRVNVVAGEGVHQHYEAALTWSDAATDLDAHGFHFERDGGSTHVWHGNRPMGPVFWHYGPSAPDTRDETIAITSAPVDGLILYAVHHPVRTVTPPVRSIADSAARVVLQLPNVRQTMHFEPPAREGNLWVPFAILDGRLITTDALVSVADTPDEATFRGMLGDLFATLPLPVATPVLDAEPLPEMPWARRPSVLWLAALATALTVLVASLRGPLRGAVMALVSLVVLTRVVQVYSRRR